MNNSVLVVDDEVLMREVLVRWLRAAGYSTTDTHDATTALELIAAEEPCVVLVDIEMPGRDGLPTTAPTTSSMTAGAAAITSPSHREMAYTVP